MNTTLPGGEQGVGITGEDNSLSKHTKARTIRSWPSVLASLKYVLQNTSSIDTQRY